MMLYHENQVAALCGVHCLNTLLQGPYLNELDLAQIAQDLDAAERAILGEGDGIEGHGNLDDSGMFGVQVLQKALEVWGLQIVPYDSSEVRAVPGWDPLNEAAFVCNLQEHWFTIRHVGTPPEWWNFNSLFPAPEPLSSFYLAAFLDSLREQGYTIFVVRGDLPRQQPGGGSEGMEGGAGRWLSPEEARAATTQAAGARQRGRVANALENAFARAGAGDGAIALNTRSAVAARQQQGMDVDDDEDPELAAAIAASLGQEEGGGGGAGAWGSAGGAAAGGFDGDQGGGAAGGEFEDDDPELAMALAASLADAQGQQQPTGGGGGSQQPAGTQQQEGASSSGAAAAAPPAPAPPAAAAVPEEPAEGEPGALTVALRLPDGSRTSRRFRGSDTLGGLAAYAAQAAGAGRVSVATQFPRKELSDLAATLAEAGVQDRSMLVVTAL